MGISSHRGTKFGRAKLDTLRYHAVKTRSLYFTWPWIGTTSWQTDRQSERQTDRITIASSTNLAQRAVARKNVFHAGKNVSERKLSSADEQVTEDTHAGTHVNRSVSKLYV